MLRLVFVPAPPHFGAGGQQIIERAARSDSSILENQNLSCPKQSRPAMTHNQTRRITFAQQTLPKLFLRRYIQRARKIVKNHKVGATREHPRRTDALNLTTRKLHAACADHRTDTVFERGQISLHCRAMEDWQ